MHVVEVMGRAVMEGHGEDAGPYLAARIAEFVAAGEDEEAAFWTMVAELVRMHRAGREAAPG